MLDFFKKMLGLKDKPLPRKEKEMLKKPELNEPVMEKKEKQEPEIVKEVLLSAVAEPVEPVVENKEEQKEAQEEEEAYVTNMPEHNLVDSDDFNPVIDDEEHEGDRELRALEEEEESD